MEERSSGGKLFPETEEKLFPLFWPKEERGKERRKKDKQLARKRDSGMPPSLIHLDVLVSHPTSSY
jgi:hypothetical protein